MIHELKLPELGDGIAKASVAVWHFKEGDAVSADDDLVEVVTDKAVFNVSADCAGILEKILVAPDQEANVGQTLALIRIKS